MCEGRYKPFDRTSAHKLISTGDPLESLFIGRPVEEDPDSQTTVSRAVNWVRKCNDHPACTTELPLLPDRVIDVGHEDGHVNLCEVKGQKGRYMSLSHCWGKVTHFTTTKASLVARKTRIDFNDLPKTYRDAIHVTRALGVSYIWIDSICICQDDREEWERESVRMTHIYMNSYLTIAASAAKNNSMGCFMNRSPKRYVEISHVSKDGNKGQVLAFLNPVRKEALPDLYIDMADHIGIASDPLPERAWTLQERVLPRRTLHFGTHQMYFECNEGFHGENGLTFPYRYHSIHKDGCHKFRGDEAENTDLQRWYQILWDYGPRKLTYGTDKLPAISGLARLYSERLNNEYVAGLWRNSLLEGLAWQGLGVTRVPQYRAPSWSWASVDGTPAAGLPENWEPVATIIDCHAEHKGNNPFGEVTSGWIKMRAPVVPLILDPRIDPEDSGHPYDNNPKVRTEKGGSKTAHSRFDFDFSGPNGREDAEAMVSSLEGVPISALILVKEFEEDVDGEGEFQYFCLIVGPAGDEGKEMRRLGFFWLDAETLGECRQIDHPEEQALVTLI
jgi:hypothetical protein